MLDKEDMEYISSLIYEEIDRGVLKRSTITVRPSSQCIIATIAIALLTSTAAGTASPFAGDGIKRLFKRVKKWLRKKVVEEREG